MMHMTYQSMMAFAESWIAAWSAGRQVSGEALYGAII